LWDIDVLINRTLVYGTLTASLALIYVASVVGVGALLRPIAGANSDLAVVVSTLAIAAAFRPLRHRIQTTIDRRFYRQKYDAAQALAAFSERLREQTDVDQVGNAVLQAAQSTVQPAHISLWLREPTENK
jgi:hypothetical protein